MTTEEIPPVWNHALKMGAYGYEVIPVAGKRAWMSGWNKRGRSSKAGISEWAALFPDKNYALICNTFFTLETDLDGADWPCERERISKALDIKESDFGFMVKTGRTGVGYHTYCDAHGRVIPKQQLTDLTTIRGVDHYVVGPGSIHPDTGAVYAAVDGHDDPAVLTHIPDYVLDSLARKRYVGGKSETERSFDLGNGAVLDLPHPPCIRRLMVRGAPNDQDYVNANHTIARYVISSGLSDADGAAIATEMATHTTGHKTTKNGFARVYNFRSCMNSARANPDANAFACSFIWGSKELCADGLCDNCPQRTTDDFTDDATPTEPEIKAAVRAEALRVMRDDDPPRYIHTQYQKGHASDSETGSVMILGKAVQNVKNAVGIQPRSTGDSGKGKTHGKARAIHLFPQEYVFRGSLSNKAPFYHDIKPMTILFLDDLTLSDDLEELARVSMTNFQQPTPHKTLEKSTNKPITLYLPERMMWAFANVDDTLDEQTINRMVGVDADETADADAKVHKITANRRKDGSLVYPITFEVLVCRDIYRILHDEICPFTVVIPFADDILWPHKENRRNFDIFCDFICGYAALRCMQRDRRDGVVFANRDDFNDAAKLYRKLYQTQTSKLNKRQLAIIQAIFNQGKSASINDLTETLRGEGFKYATVRNILLGRDGKPGLLGRVPGLTYTDEQSTTSKTTKDDSGSETETKSDRSAVFTLPWNFEILESYDEGSIELPDGASENIDLQTFTLSHHYTPLSHPVCECLDNLNIAKIPSKDEINALISDYTTTLHNTTHTFTQISNHTGGAEKKDTYDDIVSFPTGVRAPVKTCESVKVTDIENENAVKTQQIENKDDNGENNFHTPDVKVPYSLPKNVKDKIYRTDDDYCAMFIGAIGAFKIMDMQKRVALTRESLPDYFCKEVADEHCIHLDDVKAGWSAVCNDRMITGYIDEICGPAQEVGKI